MLVGLCVTGLAVAWLWTSIAATIEDQPTAIKVLAPPGLLLVACSTCLVLTQAPMRWRCWLFLSGLCGTLSLGYVVAPAPIWAYCGVLAVSIASLLAGPGASFIVAFLLSSVVLGLSQMLPPAAGAVDLYLALGLVCATAVVSWLSSRNLYTVLHWAMYSQARAWETARELRGRRQQLRRTLTSLRNAHAVLARTTRELEDARLEAEEARRVKSRFVSNISHELRTPLNIIVGFAEMLCTSPETYGDPDWPPALREDLFTIWRNAEHLLSMVDDVLDLAQIEAARLPIVPERTDLAQLIRDTLVTASALIRESGLDLRVSLPPKLGDLDIDRTRIRQVLLNLINNAVRFTLRARFRRGHTSRQARRHLRRIRAGGRFHSTLQPGKRAGSDDIETLRAPPRRAHVGRKRSWQGEHLLFHASPTRKEDSRSARSPSSFLATGAPSRGHPRNRRCGVLGPLGGSHSSATPRRPTSAHGHVSARSH